MRDALQTNLSRYEVYFNAAGGPLNVKKCFYYLVNFVWTGTQWRYQTNSEMQLDPIIITRAVVKNHTHRGMRAKISYGDWDHVVKWISTEVYVVGHI